MSGDKFSPEYFSSYEEKSRVFGLERGRRWYQFSYWRRYLAHRLKAGASVLELGCGLGYFAEVVSRKYNYVGTDISLFPLLSARSKSRADNLIRLDASRLSFGSGTFDAVFAFDMLEHVSDPGSVISEISRVLKKGGIFVATTPNTRSFGNRLKGPLSGLVPSMLKDETHVSLLAPDEWAGLLEASGFNIGRFASDTLWDIPYSRKMPLIFQKTILIPFNLGVCFFMGCLPWSLGENLVLVCTK